MRSVDFLYHYTNSEGLKGILGENALHASTTVEHPADARHGDGKYFTDIKPDEMTPARLSRRLVGHPFSGRRFTHFILVDVRGFEVHEVRDHVFLIPGADPLDLAGRIVDHGIWQHPGPASS